MDYLKPAKDLLTKINQNNIPELFISNGFYELGNIPYLKLLFPIFSLCIFPDEKLDDPTFKEAFEIYGITQRIKFDQAVYELRKRDLLYCSEENTGSHFFNNNESRHNFKVYRPTLRGSTWQQEIKAPFWEIDTVNFLKANFKNINQFLTSEFTFVRDLVKKYN